MLPFSLFGGFISTMNNRNSKSPRKKLPGGPDLCPSDLQDKLNEIASPFTSKANMPALDKLALKADIPDTVIKVEQASSLSLCGKKIALGTSSSSMWQKSYMATPSGNGCIEKSTSELVGLLTKQLYLAENQMRRMQIALSTAEEEMETKDKEIARLKRKMQECKASRKREQELIRSNKELRSIGRQYHIETADQLCKKCVKLRSRVDEMEEFLNHYGLTWVVDSSRFKDRKDRSQTLLPKNYIDTCFEQLLASVDRLNLSVGKDEVQVRHNKVGSGAYFKSPSCMHLKFYKNGLLIKGGRLRSYNDISTAKFVRDILDGYFPSELQQKYPDGVAFKVEDRRAEIFIGHGSEFPGTGYVLGKPTPSRSSSSTNICSFKRCKLEESSSRPHRERLQSNKQIRQTNASTSPTCSARTLTSGRTADSPTRGSKSLRSQILECHNNNCSDSHIQSHVNAELRLSPRKIEAERTPSMKIAELRISSDELKKQTKALITRTPSRTDSPEIIPKKLSSNIVKAKKSDEKANNVVPSRSRLRSNVSNNHVRQARSLSRSTCAKSSSGTAKKSTSVVSSPRVSKSATSRSQGSTSPLIVQINEPLEKLDELRLKVRSFNGSTVFLVHLSSAASVEKLYQILDKALSRGCPRAYKILATGFDEKSGNFVKQRLERFNVSLKDYGIETDSVLHLVNDEKRLNVKL